MQTNETLARHAQGIADALVQYFATINKTDLETAGKFIALNWNTPAVTDMVKLGVAAAIVASNE
jgi:hypothetical protein